MKDFATQVDRSREGIGPPFSDRGASTATQRRPAIPPRRAHPRQRWRWVHGEAAKPFEAKLETREDVAVWTTRELEDANRARVQALLDDNMSIRDIADETGISKSKVQRIKKSLEAARSTDAR
jgi:AraC-like DNA-binding protein